VDLKAKVKPEVEILVTLSLEGSAHPIYIQLSISTINVRYRRILTRIFVANKEKGYRYHGTVGFDKIPVLEIIVCI
jgi:hypothetical protein